MHKSYGVLLGHRRPIARHRSYSELLYWTVGLQAYENESPCNARSEIQIFYTIALEITLMSTIITTFTSQVSLYKISPGHFIATLSVPWFRSLLADLYLLQRVTFQYDADQDESFADPEQINLVHQVGTEFPFHIGSTGDIYNNIAPFLDYRKMLVTILSVLV